MKKLLAIAVALSLGGCASLQKDWNAVTGATVSPEAVLVAGNSFDALEATATNYLTFCKANRALPVCSNYVGARKQILPAVRAARVARNNLETFIQQNPGQLGPSGLYNALTSAVATLQGIVNSYAVGAK
jgi:hypothetical protein